jgi:diguanylate cyclase (GGDEF)-like protein/PAS domain S-box-containing protein
MDRTRPAAVPASSAVGGDHRGGARHRAGRRDATDPAPSLDLTHRPDDELFFRALDASSDAVLLSRGSDAHLLYVNEAFVALCRYGRDEVIGRTVEELGLWNLAAVGEDPSDDRRAAEIVVRSKDGTQTRATLSTETVDIRGEPCLLRMIRDDSERRRLEETVVHLASIVESSHDAVITATADGTITSWNAAAERMFGHRPEEAIGRPVAIMCPPDRLHELDEILERVRAGEHAGVLETVRMRRDGTPINVSLMVSPTRDADGRITGSWGLVRDITDRKLAMDQLREAEAKYRSLVERIPVVTYVDAVDRTSSAVYMSPQVQEMLGYPQGQWQSEPDLWVRTIHPDDRERVLAESDRTNQTGEPFTMEYRLLHRDGRTVWVRDEAMLVRDELGNPRIWQGMLLDISDRKRAEEDMAFLAYHDKLTGLPNRVMFEEMLELALTRAGRHGLAVAVLYVDLDNFKNVNDSLGHDAGDDVLRQTALRLQDAARAADVVARHGGDEFLVLLSDLDREPKDDVPAPATTAEMVAGRLEEALQQPFVVHGADFAISASVGISLYPFDARDGVELLRHADFAMYQAKQGGKRGHARYAAEEEGPGQVSLASRLRKAAERQRWELHYQPIVRLADAELVGLEALLRWQDPRAGLIPPARFIRLAEQTGISEAIGDWVLEEACRQTRTWRDAGLTGTTWLNLSPRQLWRRDFVTRTASLLSSWGLEPADLGVEVTEATAMADPARASTVLHDLRAAGIRIAVDDFGTGASSLSLFTDLPVDVLKVDRTLVGRIAGGGPTAAMVAAIVQFASSLGVQAVAEGVEAEEQRRWLLERGCALGQGYLFGRPVAASAITARFRRSGSRFEPGAAGG